MPTWEDTNKIVKDKDKAVRALSTVYSMKFNMDFLADFDSTEKDKVSSNSSNVNDTETTSGNVFKEEVNEGVSSLYEVYRDYVWGKPR